MLSRNLSHPSLRSERWVPVVLALVLASALVLAACAGEDDASVTDDDLEDLLASDKETGAEVAEAAAEDDASDVEEAEVAVPEVVGDALAEALDLVEAEQLEAVVEGDEPYDRDAVALMVTDQRPEAGEAVSAGEAVELTVEPEWVWGPCEDVLALDERFPGSLHGEEDLAADGVEVPYEHAWACEHLIEGDQDEDRYEAARELADLRADEERFNQFAPAGMAGAVDDGGEGGDPLSVFGWAIAEADAGELDDVPTPDAAGGLAPFVNHNQVWNKVVTPVRDTLLLREDIEELDAPPEGSGGNAGRFGYVYSQTERERFEDPVPQLVVAWYQDEDANSRALIDQVYVELQTLADEEPSSRNRIGRDIAVRRLEDEVLDVRIDQGWSDFHSERVVPDLNDWHDQLGSE